MAPSSPRLDASAAAARAATAGATAGRAAAAAGHEVLLRALAVVLDLEALGLEQLQLLLQGRGPGARHRGSLPSCCPGSERNTDHCGERRWRSGGWALSTLWRSAGHRQIDGCPGEA